MKTFDEATDSFKIENVSEDDFISTWRSLMVEVRDHEFTQHLAEKMTYDVLDELEAPPDIVVYLWKAIYESCRAALVQGVILGIEMERVEDEPLPDKPKKTIRRKPQ